MKNLILKGIEHGFAGIALKPREGFENIDTRITPERVERLEPGQIINLLGWLAKADNPCSQQARRMLEEIAKEGQQYSHRVLAQRALGGN